MEQGGCSLSRINDEVCHHTIKCGTCPGFAKAQCTNKGALAALSHRYYCEVEAKVAIMRAARRDGKKAFGHFIDQNDIERPQKRSVEATLIMLSRFMMRVRRRISTDLLG